MATRTVRNRRRPDEDEAPAADDYAPRGRRGGGDEDEDRTERRPRRGRGELPGRETARDPEPEVTQEGTPIPTSRREVDKLEDDDWDDLVAHFGLDNPDEAELWKAIEASREEPEEPRRGRRGRAAEEEPEETPRRGRRGRSEPEEEEEAPRRGRGRSRDEEEPEEPRRGRRGRSSEDEDEDRPTRKRRPGFEGYKKTREKTFTEDFKLTEEEILVKFLEDEPFDTWAEHHLFQELHDGQRVWICIEDDCPICATGHKPKAFAAYNVVVIPEEGDPTVEVLRAGPALSKELAKKAGLKTGPLSKEYYSLYLVKPEGGKKGPTTTHADVVRERDVKDEWKFEPFTDKELDEFAENTVDPDTYIQLPSKAALRGVAKKLREDD